MSTLTADDLAVIRSWCGTSVGTPDGDVFGATDLTARMDRLADPLAVSLEVLRQVRADFLRDPSKLTLVGDYTEDTTVNLEWLDRQIGQLEAATGDVTGRNVASVGFMRRRPGARR